MGPNDSHPGSASDDSLSILLLNHGWFAPELRALGHRVLTAGWAHSSYDVPFARLTHIRDLIASLPGGFVPDRIVYFDDSHSVSVLGLETIDIPALFYSIDAHHHLYWHTRFAALFDVVAVAQPTFLPEFAADNPDGAGGWLHWLPLWAPIMLEPAPDRDILVSFRGTMDPKLHPKRVEFFEQLSKHVPVDAAAGPIQDVYPRSQIVVNQNVGTDLNFRVFEALMAGALLVTPRASDGLNELFEDGRDLVTYENGNVEEATALILKYLVQEKEREEIAARGRQKVLQLHSPAVRAGDLELLLLNLERRPKPLIHFAAASTYLHAVGSYRDTSGSLESGNALPEHRVLLEAARDNLVQSAERGEVLDEDFCASVILCKCYLEVLENRERLLQFSQGVRSAYPTDLILTLSYLEDLMQAGLTDNARKVASEISPVPDELLASLTPVMQAAKSQVKESVPFC
ncbi:MAG: glycosyltransferase [Bdellovibrionota bacterium]